MDAFADFLRRIGLDLTAFANLVGRMKSVAFVAAGQRRSLTVAAGATSASVRHSLGRPYQGALIEHQTGALAGLYVVSPGDDADTQLRVAVTSAPVAAVTLSVWIF